MTKNERLEPSPEVTVIVKECPTVTVTKTSETVPEIKVESKYKTV